MEVVSKRDKRMLKPIRAFLQAGAMENGLVSSVDEGTPQGGPLSPLLSNIVLDDLDQSWGDDISDTRLLDTATTSIVLCGSSGNVVRCDSRSSLNGAWTPSSPRKRRAARTVRGGLPNHRAYTSHCPLPIPSRLAFHNRSACNS
jgi:hypothetical protein